jgi:hypothetical protein
MLVVRCSDGQLLRVSGAGDDVQPFRQQARCWMDSQFAGLDALILPLSCV